MEIVLSGLLASLLTLGISTWFYLRHEKRTEKFKVLRKLAGTRYILTEKPSSPEAQTEFFRTLNEAYVVFHSSAPVVEKLKDFHRFPDRTAENIVELLNSIAKDLGVDKALIDDEFLKTPFVPRGT